VPSHLGTERVRFDTKVVHEGQHPTAGTGDLVPPVHLASTYDRFAQDPLRYTYARGENPTRENLEECLGSLEGTGYCTVYSSGQAAASTVLSLLSPGGRLVVSDDVYGGTYSLLSTLARYGIRVDRVDLSDPTAMAAALGLPVAMLWIETPTNPLLKVTDVAAASDLAHRQGALVIVDNTFASPALQQPLRLGADVSLYSTTKFIAGHSDVLGGALVCAGEEPHRRFLEHRGMAGNVPGALDCFLVHRGVKTLSLRVARQVGNARRVVAELGASPRVAELRYPGLPDHPQHDVAARQMSEPGSIVSFRYLGDPEKLLAGTSLFAAAVSLGGVRSLIECPAMMTHRALPAATREALGITDDLIRLSIGIEDPDDLAEDLMRCL
jgi:cystathionine beta-lyase/cystathionine gamma-synthase